MEASISIKIYEKDQFGDFRLTYSLYPPNSDVDTVATAVTAMGYEYFNITAKTRIEDIKYSSDPDLKRFIEEKYAK